MPNSNKPDAGLGGLVMFRRNIFDFLVKEV